MCGFSPEDVMGIKSFYNGINPRNEKFEQERSLRMFGEFATSLDLMLSF